MDLVVDAPSLPAALFVPDEAEALVMRHEQVECPVLHRFGPGLYIRELHMKAGTLAVGHKQRFDHMNVMLQGRVLMLNEDGSTRELVAPLMFIGQPGRKAGIVLEDVVWQNIYATEERDIDKLEEVFFDKGDHWKAADAASREAEWEAHQVDRDDFEQMLLESGFSREVVKTQSENLADQCDFAGDFVGVRIAQSSIAGKGVFATFPTPAGATVAPGLVNSLRTPAGRYTNHSANPNAVMVRRMNGDIDLVATRDIRGCISGGPGEEVTVDYRQVLALSGIHCIKGVHA